MRCENLKKNIQTLTSLTVTVIAHHKSLKSSQNSHPRRHHDDNLLHFRLQQGICHNVNEKSDFAKAKNKFSLVRSPSEILAKLEAPFPIP